MAKPASRILVINDESLVLREFVKGLNAAARSLDNPLGIGFIGVTTAKEALEVIARDGDLQAVLVDDTLYTPKKGLLSAIRKHPAAQALIIASCTYDGLRYALPPIIEAAPERGIKVIIDE